MSDGVVTLHRAELYKQVWSEPMSHLARRYGISDVALAKICRKTDVPHPLVGYWQRKKAGYNIPQPVLPPLRRGVPESVTVTPQSPATPPSEEVRAKISEERIETNWIKVSTRLVNPHSLVSQTMGAPGTNRRRLRE